MTTRKSHSLKINTQIDSFFLSLLWVYRVGDHVVSRLTLISFYSQGYLWISDSLVSTCWVLRLQMCVTPILNFNSKSICREIKYASDYITWPLCIILIFMSLTRGNYNVSLNYYLTFSSFWIPNIDGLCHHETSDEALMTWWF